MVNSDVNATWRIRARRRLISKSSSECSIDQNAYSYSVDGKRLKQVLLPNITMMNIDKENTLPKRCNKK